MVSPTAPIFEISQCRIPVVGGMESLVQTLVQKLIGQLNDRLIDFQVPINKFPIRLGNLGILFRHIGANVGQVREKCRKGTFQEDARFVESLDRK